MDIRQSVPMFGIEYFYYDFLQNLSLSLADTVKGCNVLNMFFQYSIIIIDLITIKKIIMIIIIIIIIIRSRRRRRRRRGRRRRSSRIIERTRCIIPWKEEENDDDCFIIIIFSHFCLTEILLKALREWKQKLLV